ncbi:NUDIX hydrolase [Rivularia sp. UHCC 0363]|uniref:NUDIX hydrolase n=1 Tax=Rivularia sp. UHCC 0363 TaxID=3110244 RepID=UPI002B215481|nr:NUDIX hydrolase [Rivularia sp. UHCC 0363]MEA5597471.1 NUDIX hydrolase [Rivularia sp. UHCC 0363]
MQHRIRAAALITQGESILLVCHKTPQTGRLWWIPPGGKLESFDQTIFDCAQREVFEETGLLATCSRIAYIRECRDLQLGVQHLELFLVADAYSGELTLAHQPPTEPDTEMIQESRWISRSELPDLVVYPEILQQDFWEDLAAGFPETRHLGSHDFNIV